MRCFPAAVGITASLIAAACGDTAVVVTVAGDLASADQLDTICLSVHDDDAAGGEFGQVYVLEDLADADELTLTVEPGRASGGVASVRGYRGGVEIARDQREFEFSGGVDDLTLRLDLCRDGGGGAAQVAGSAPSAPAARAAVSFGRGGTVVVVVAPGFAAVYAASGGALAAVDEVLPPVPGAVADAIAFDADGDCDDDVLIVSNAGLVLWRRDGTVFTEVDGAFDADGGIAAAVADIDGDGDLDVIAGGGGVLIAHRNNGTGQFQRATITGVTDVTALGFGDINADGNVDLVVGQGDAVGGFTRVFFNDAAGSGAFALAPAALPELPLRVRDLALADANGDGFDDVFLAIEGGGVRVYVNRGDGRLEDRSFVLLPAQPGDAGSVAAADWNGDCLVDVVLGFPTADAIAWSGTDGGALGEDTLPAAAGDRVTLADIDDDGDYDLLLVGDEEVTWVDR